MVCRRRWQQWDGLLVLVALAPSITFAAPPVPATEAARMKAATTPKEIIDARIKVVFDPEVPTDAVKRDQYGLDLARAFSPLLAEANPLVQLNAAMAIAQIETISSDAALRDMLKHKMPEVRYWGAKGLATIAPRIIKVGAQGVIADLRAAGTDEKSGVVQQEILRAQIAYDDFAGVLDSLDALVKAMPGSISERGVLDALKLGLDAVDKPVKAANDADKTRAADIAARVASFTAQQHVALEAAQKTIQQPVPPPYIASANAAIASAVKVMSSATGTTFKQPAPSTTTGGQANALVDVLGITGNDATPGSVQKANPKVKIPPTIKTAG